MSKEIESREKLKKGVSMLYEMELNNYLMVRAIQKLDAEIARLGFRNKFYVPTKDPVHVGGGPSDFGFLGGILGLIIGGISGCSMMDSLFEIGTLLGSLILGVIICATVGAIIGVITDSSESAKKEKAAQEKYDRELIQYKAQIKADEARVAKENECKKCLQEARAALINKKEKSTSLLHEMYQAVGIEKDFRSLMAIGYMNDYIRLGIATHLEGLDGLNYLIRKEVQASLLQLTLEEISNKLDTIISNQEAIYHELTKMNEKCDKMIQSLGQVIRVGIQNGQKMDEIRDNTSVAAYNIERMRKEEEIRYMLSL